MRIGWNAPTLELWTRRGAWCAGLFLAFVVAANLIEVFFSSQSESAYWCTEPVFQFGAATAGATVEHTFEVRNPSRTDIEISKVLSSCGCMITTVDLTGEIIRPTESRFVSVKLTTDGLEGAVTKPLAIVLKGKSQPVVLRMVGKIVPRDRDSQQNVIP